MLPPEFQKLPYRPCVGIMLLNTDNHIFVGERLDNLGAWQMPQGGIDPGEDVHQAAMREMMEEVGTNQADIIKVADTKVRYDLPAERIPNFWNGKYRGQEQTWVALHFKGQDSDIILDNHHEPEFNQWKWVKPKETIDLIVPFKRELYMQVLNLFDDILSP